ncbi:MAG TPA: hypothetical protein VKP69_33785, partial [Isosphaeraceae bacterium]|nr:hypothetical protein [Isosphaeraceae bacterium]
MPPVKYLEAGARLFNDGQYPLAAKYLQAAQMYRDQLTDAERTVLDAYLKEMLQIPAQGGSGPATPAPAPAPSAPAPAPSEPTPSPAPAPSEPSALTPAPSP